MPALLSQSATKQATACCSLAPVRPAVALRHCFKSSLPQQQQPRSAVVMSAAQVSSMLDGDKLVSGMDKSAMADLLQLPKGYHWYETMIILKSTLNDEERDKELAKFEAFLNKEECLNINALVRPSSRMAYNIKTHYEGIYVLYTYAARRQTARTVQTFLSTPDVGSEEVVLRHITFCKH